MNEWTFQAHIQRQDVVPGKDNCRQWVFFPERVFPMMPYDAMWGHMMPYDDKWSHMMTNDDVLWDSQLSEIIKNFNITSSWRQKNMPMMQQTSLQYYPSRDHPFSKEITTNVVQRCFMKRTRKRRSNRHSKYNIEYCLHQMDVWLPYQFMSLKVLNNKWARSNISTDYWKSATMKLSRWHDIWIPWAIKRPLLNAARPQSSNNIYTYV